MKKYVIMVYALIIMGACSTAPKARESLDKQIDLNSSEAKTFMESFNNRKYYDVVDTGSGLIVTDDLMRFDSTGTLVYGSSSYGYLYSFDGDRMILRPGKYYIGFTIQNDRLIHHGVKKYLPVDSSPTEEEFEKMYSFDNINWNINIGDTNLEDNHPGKAFIFAKTK